MRVEKTVNVRLEGGQELSLSEAAARSVVGQISAQLRSSFGGGRPRETQRCPCGKFTVARAKSRYHHCVAKGEKGKSAQAEKGKRGKGEKPLAPEKGKGGKVAGRMAGKGEKGKSA